ncbi:MAG: protein-glutamine glutaminase family protein [Bdellovibrionota bacterium]
MQKFTTKLKTRRLLLLAFALSFLLTPLANGKSPDQSALSGLQQQIKKINQGTRMAPCPSCKVDEAKPGEKSATAEIKDVFNEKILISAVSKQKAEELFREMAGHKEIPFGYPQDGCYARAQEMARLLETKGIVTAKIFSQGSLMVKILPAQELEWDWHVAPVLAVKEAGKIEIYVIDPALFAKPVTVKEWAAAQEAGPEAKVESLNYTKRFVYKYNWGSFDKKNKWDQADLDDAKSVNEKYGHLQSLNNWTATPPSPVLWWLPANGAVK